MQHLLKPIFVTASFLFCWILSFGQTADSIGSNIQFNHLNVANGLSQSTVLSIHQDTYGFMWIGTRDGLNLYDTNTFRVFRPSIGDSSSISGHIINEIAEDAENNIWVATQNSLSKYDRRLNSFTNYQEFPTSKQALSISTLFIDKKDRIWVGGNFGILRFDIKKEKFYYPEINNDDPEKINVNSIQEDAEGNLWIGAENFGLYRFHPEKKQWDKLEIKTLEIDSRIEAIEVEENVGLWLGTYGSGLVKIDFSGNILNYYHQNAAEQLKISNNNIRALEMDKAKNMWIGTFDGLNIVNGNGNSLAINYHENNSKGLSHSSIRSLFKDEKGAIWIGTYFGGLNIYDKDNQRFEHFHNIEGDENSLSFNVVGAFSEDINGDIYIGTERGGLNILDSKKNTHKKPNHRYDGLTIKSLFHDDDNQLWLGIFKKGLNHYNSKNGNLTMFPVNQPTYNFLKTSIINDIQKDEEGNLWIATDAEGVRKFNPKTRKFVDFPHQEELTKQLRFIPIKSIEILKDQRLSLATIGKGILFFNRKTGTIEQQSTFEFDTYKIDIDEFNHVYEDQHNNVWISSNGKGLLRYDILNSSFSHFDIKKGLSNNIVQGVLEDANGSIWAITLNGISKVDVDVSNNIVKSYTNSSGIPLNEINEGAFFKTSNNEFLIGGNNGYIKFDPTSLQDNNYIPKMAFTGMELMNKLVLPNDETEVLQKELNKTEKITLSYFQSILTLEFVALSYLKSENNHYKYKLEGFDKDWIYTKEKPRVTYTNLRKGDYIFYAKGSNNDGIWNEEPLKLQITIKPPPWQTWWAYCTYAVLILGGFYVVRSNGIRSAKLKHSLKIEQLEKERWKDVHDIKLQHFMDVSHEFRTPLSLIAAPLEEILKVKKLKPKVKALTKTMDLNVKRLQMLIDQILELRALETGHSRLNLEPVNLNFHIEQIINSFKTLADKNNIKLVLTNDSTDTKLVMADLDKLDKVLFNLIYNAFKFTPAGGEILLSIKTVEKQNHISYTFVLKDTGIGIEPELLPNIFDRFKKKNQVGSGTGIGLALTKSLVEIMEGSIVATSNLGKGTAFTLTLNFNEAEMNEELVETSSYALPFPIEHEVFSSEIIDEEITSEQAQILIVEDNKELRNYLKEKLKKHYNILSASNGKKGLEKAKKYGPDLIISDVMMPQMDGLDLCKVIKADKVLCHIPVILLTAKVSKISKMEGFETGADAYLPKPFSLEELKLRIKNILKNQEQLQQKYQKLSTPYLKEEKLLNPQDEKLMTSILSVINDNMDQPNFTVEFLGTEAGLSRVHLFRKLKSLTGMSPSDFIRDIRMKNACKLLETQQYKPSDVAYMVGFQDTKYFSLCFKKHTGLSPSKYIKNLKNEGLNRIKNI